MTDRPAVDLAALRAQAVREGVEWDDVMVLLDAYAEAVEAIVDAEATYATGELPDYKWASATLASLAAEVQREAEK